MWTINDLDDILALYIVIFGVEGSGEARRILPLLDSRVFEVNYLAMDVENLEVFSLETHDDTYCVWTESKDVTLIYRIKYTHMCVY